VPLKMSQFRQSKLRVILVLRPVTTRTSPVLTQTLLPRETVFLFWHVNMTMGADEYYIKVHHDQGFFVGYRLPG
jgi:hypothetical protein